MNEYAKDRVDKAKEIALKLANADYTVLQTQSFDAIVDSTGVSVEVEGGFWYKPALKRIEFMVVYDNNNFECFVPCLVCQPIYYIHNENI
jgi:hypothetical protein